MPLTVLGDQRPPGLQRLIFCSQSTAQTGAELDRDLQDIIAASLRNNGPAEVTGFLLSHQGWFLQALEGPKAAVTEAFDRMKPDRRHVAPKVIISRPAEQRCFALSALNARRLTCADDATLARFQPGRLFEPHKLTARNALGLLMTASQTVKPAKSILWLT